MFPLHSDSASAFINSQSLKSEDILGLVKWLSGAFFSGGGGASKEHLIQNEGFIEKGSLKFDVGICSQFVSKSVFLIYIRQSSAGTLLCFMWNLEIQNYCAKIAPNHIFFFRETLNVFNKIFLTFRKSTLSRNVGFLR